MIKFDKGLISTIKNLRAGVLNVPDYLNKINPPSLWAYYSTLPSWARNDPIVRNVMMTMEYHKPNLDIRQKENALNLACSFLRPIDSTLKEVLVQAAASTKVQMTMKKGQQMLNELQFYELDEQWLGSESEDFEEDNQDGEKDIATIIKQSMALNEEEKELTPMEAAL